MSIDVNPNTALVTWPEAVAMSVGQGEERPVGQRVAVDQQERGRRPYGTRPALAAGSDVAGDDALGHGPHGVRSRMAVLLDERERLGLGQAVLVHEHALGPVDDLAGLELLLEAGGLRRASAFISRKRPRATSMAGISSGFWNGLTR